jgi:hypothetical protein
MVDQWVWAYITWVGDIKGPLLGIHGRNKLSDFKLAALQHAQNNAIDWIQPLSLVWSKAVTEADSTFATTSKYAQSPPVAGS